ncbi:MAG TPA: hypothetical protein PK649_12210 [Vicingus sp.]|nr:hypothetical protein [Vicingus sp.]
MKNERTPKETAKAVETAVSEITKVMKAVPVMIGFDFFDENGFRKHGLNELIAKISDRYGISEKHIRTIGGWK